MEPAEKGGLQVRIQIPRGSGPELRERASESERNRYRWCAHIQRVWPARDRVLAPLVAPVRFSGVAPAPAAAAAVATGGRARRRRRRAPRSVCLCCCYYPPRRAVFARRSFTVRCVSLGRQALGVPRCTAGSSCDILACARRRRPAAPRRRAAAYWAERSDGGALACTAAFINKTCPCGGESATRSGVERSHGWLKWWRSWGRSRLSAAEGNGSESEDLDCRAVIVCVKGETEWLHRIRRLENCTGSTSGDVTGLSKNCRKPGAASGRYTRRADSERRRTWRQCLEFRRFGWKVTPNSAFL